MKTGRWLNWMRVALHLVVLRPAVKLFCGLFVSGGEHLRRLKRFVIFANHNSHLDVLLLFQLLAPAEIAVTHPVADEAYFSRSKLLFALVRFLFQPVWIRRGHPDNAEDGLRVARELIEAGHNLIIFPEGTRGRPGELSPFKSGLGRLVSQCPGIPLVPVFLAGPERVLPKAYTFPLPFWGRVLVGPPQLCQGAHRDITRHLQNTLVQLSRSGNVHRRPRQRRLRQPAPMLAVLGIDGSGKSTIARAVARRLSGAGGVCLVSDRLEFYDHDELQPLQPLGVEALRGVVSRYAKSARSLAAYKIPKLTELILRDRLLGEVERWYAPALLILDGSPLLNLAAWAALYGRDQLSDERLATAIGFLAGQERGLARSDPVFVELPELRQLDRLGLTHLKLPQGLVLLDLPAAAACARIVARGQPLQPHEAKEGLQRLREAYGRVAGIVERHWHLPVLVVDAMQPLDQVAEQAAEFFKATATPPTNP